MESAAPAKLAVDFLPGTRLRAGMDDDTSDLVALRCTHAGMTMEDASVVALTVTGMEQDERLAALVELDAAAARITVLVRAARVLLS
jgi:hypothetical protein